MLLSSSPCQPSSVILATNLQAVSLQYFFSSGVITDKEIAFVSEEGV